MPAITFDDLVDEQSQPSTNALAFDDLAPPVKDFSRYSSEPSGFFRRYVSDPSIGLAKGIVSLPESIVGLADIPTFGIAGKVLEAGGYGFQPKLTKEILSKGYSPEHQAAIANVQKAKGFIPTIRAMVENPSTIVDTVLESAPSMLGGAGIARKVLASAPKIGALAAGAIGEGAITAGQQAEQTRQESESGLLTPKQAALSATSGAVTGLIGVLGGGLAKRLGVTDIDTLIAGGAVSSQAAKKNILRRVVESAITEGAFEELPQSAQEQLQQNLSNNKPPLEGVGEAAAQGLLAGLIMGGAGGALAPVFQRSSRRTPEERLREMAAEETIVEEPPPETKPRTKPDTTEPPPPKKPATTAAPPAAAMKILLSRGVQDDVAAAIAESVGPKLPDETGEDYRIRLNQAHDNAGLKVAREQVGATNEQDKRAVWEGAGRTPEQIEESLKLYRERDAKQLEELNQHNQDILAKRIVRKGAPDAADRLKTSVEVGEEKPPGLVPPVPAGTSGEIQKPATTLPQAKAPEINLTAIEDRAIEEIKKRGQVASGAFTAEAIQNLLQVKDATPFVGIGLLKRVPEGYEFNERVQALGTLKQSSAESPGTGTSALDASRETLASTPPLETKPVIVEATKELKPIELMTFDEFSASRGVSVTPTSFPEYHRKPGGASKASERSASLRVGQALTEWQQKRNELRAEYDKLVESGAMREPTRREKLERTAQGEGEAAEAARRILEKEQVATVPEKLQVAKLAEVTEGSRLNKLGDPYTTTYHATPADWAEWQSLLAKPLMEEGVWPAREALKNKYGGMPPEAPVTPKTEIAEPVVSESAAGPATPKDVAAQKQNFGVGGKGGVIYNADYSASGFGTERMVTVRDTAGNTIGQRDPFHPQGIPTARKARKSRIAQVAREIVQEHEATKASAGRSSELSSDALGSTPSAASSPTPTAPRQAKEAKALDRIRTVNPEASKSQMDTLKEEAARLDKLIKASKNGTGAQRMRLEMWQKITGQIAKIESGQSVPLTRKEVVSAENPKSSFIGKIAKEQKKFLLDATDQAIAEAPDVPQEEVTKQWETSEEHTDQQTALKWAHENQVPKEPSSSYYIVEEEGRPTRFQADHDQWQQDVLEWHRRAETDLAPLIEKYQAPRSISGAVDRVVTATSNTFHAKRPHITIEVPGDGEFNLVNTKDALRDFKSRAEKFPTTSPRAPKLSTARTTPSKVPDLGDTSTENVVKAAALAVSTDEGRVVLHNISSDGKQTVGTNGRWLLRIFKSLGGTEKKPATFTTDGKPVKDADVFPNWKQVIPEESKLTKIFTGLDTGKLWTILKQAEQMVSEKSNSIKVWRNTDGTIGISASNVDVGSYEHNVLPDAKLVTAISPYYFMDTLEAARRTGSEKVDVHWTDELSPLVIRGKTMEAVIMPYRMEGVDAVRGGWLTKYDLAKTPAERTKMMREELALIEKFSKHTPAEDRQAEWLREQLGEKAKVEVASEGRYTITKRGDGWTQVTDNEFPGGAVVVQDFPQRNGEQRAKDWIAKQTGKHAVKPAETSTPEPITPEQRLEQQQLIEVQRTAKGLEAQRRQLQRILDPIDAKYDSDAAMSQREIDLRDKLPGQIAEIEAKLLEQRKISARLETMELPTTPEANIAERAIAGIEDLQKKLRGTGSDVSMGVPKAILDLALEVARLSLKAGNTIYQAIDAAIAKIREQLGGIPFDESEVRASLNRELTGDARAEQAGETPEMARGQVEGMEDFSPERVVEKVAATKAAIREKFYDGRKPISTEHTQKLWDYLHELLGPNKGALADRVHAETNADMGPGLFLKELQDYAVKLLVEKGDSSALLFILDNYQDFALRSAINPTVSGGGREQRVLRELSDTPVLEAFKAIWAERDITGATAANLTPEVFKELAQRLRNVKIEPEVINAVSEVEFPSGRKSLKPLIDALLATPYRTQQSPEWRRATAIKWFEDNGMTNKEAIAAADKFQEQFNKMLADASEKLARKLLAGTLPKTLVKLIDKIRAGIYDPSKPWADELAKENGWRKPSPEQSKRMAEIDEKFARPGLTVPERAVLTAELMKVVRHIGVKPSIIDTLSANLVVTNLTGLKTNTINIFAPLVNLGWERVLSTFVYSPSTSKTLWKSAAKFLFEDFAAEFEQGMDKDAFAFVSQEMTGARNEMERVWEAGIEDWKAGKKGQAIVKLTYGLQQYQMRFLSSADQANMMVTRNSQLVLYALDAFKQAKLDIRDIDILSEMTVRMKQQAFDEAMGRGADAKTAMAVADYQIGEMLQDFMAGKVGALKARQLVDAATLDAHSSVGRQAEGIEWSDEGGILSRLGLNRLMQIATELRRGGGAEPALGITLLGYLNVPLRTTRFLAWNSPYGLLRLGIHQFRKQTGRTNWWKQSLANEFQERHRLRMAIASTVAQVLMLTLFRQLIKSSADDRDDDGKPKDGLYFTGQGPKSKQLRDAWEREGFNPGSIVYMHNGKPAAFPLTRIGEALAPTFAFMSAQDDYGWRKKEKEATGKPFEESIDKTLFRGVGTYLYLLGQRGLLQQAAQIGRLGQEGGVTKIVAGTASSVAAGLVTPFLGAQRTISAALGGAIDRSSISSAVVANWPILFWTPAYKFQVNRFGDKLYDQSWYGKALNVAGMPFAFRVQDTRENQELYQTLVLKGAAPPDLRRSTVEQRYGEMSDEQFAQFAQKSGDLLKSDTLRSLEWIKTRTDGKSVKTFLSDAAQRADAVAAIGMGFEPVAPAASSGSRKTSIQLGSASGRRVRATPLPAIGAMRAPALIQLPAPRRSSGIRRIGKVRASMSAMRPARVQRLSSMRVPRLRRARGSIRSTIGRSRKGRVRRNLYLIPKYA